MYTHDPAKNTYARTVAGRKSIGFLIAVYSIYMSRTEVEARGARDFSDLLYTRQPEPIYKAYIFESFESVLLIIIRAKTR